MELVLLLIDVHLFVYVFDGYCRIVILYKEHSLVVFDWPHSTGNKETSIEFEHSIFILVNFKLVSNLFLVKLKFKLICYFLVINN